MWPLDSYRVNRHLSAYEVWFEITPNMQSRMNYVMEFDTGRLT